jgi:hypothetical protein
LGRPGWVAPSCDVGEVGGIEGIYKSRSVVTRVEIA